MRRGTRGCGYGGSGRPPVPHQHQPQNNIPRLLQPLQPHTGPLMTDHLQGLKDIDMELELLKRKREIIEQQQILSDSYRQINDYEPMFSQGHQSRYDDYTRLYDNPRESNQYGGRGEGSRKRAHIPVWESEEPAKRYSGSSRGGKKPFAPRLSPPRPNFKRAPEPLFSAPKSYRRPPPPAREKKEFYPSKVSKSSGAPPVKLASYQPAERKRLVTAAVASGAARGADPPVLRADREPTHLMVGRLELALGAVMKDVKSAHPQHAALFQQQHVLRAMKQLVRDRIRTAMIGKPVSHTADILAAYYQMFPLGQDDDVMTKGLMAHTNKDFILVETANPEQYFKKNMRNLMTLKMEEMLNKLNEHYGGVAIMTNNPYVRSQQPEHQQKRRVRYRRPKPFGTVQPNPKNEDAEDSPLNEAEKTDENKQAEETQTKPNVQIKTENEDEIKARPENEETEETKNEGVNKEPTPDKSAENQPEVELVKPAPAETPATVVPKNLINNEMYMALDRLMTYKMLHLLKRFAPEFINHMDLDAMYRETKAAIVNGTAKGLGMNYKVVAGAVKTEPAAQDSPKQTPERLPLQYYARILGKPSLPKRKAMENFFSAFKPKSIKKHRTIHNLLFVGFSDEEPYQNMLAADGTAIGRFTLDIKTSDRNDNKKTPTAAKDDTKSEKDKLNESTDTIIGSDLDDQITELLTSIRNTDKFANDVNMAEPANNEVEKEDQTKMEEVVDCDAEPNATEESEDDVVELKDVLTFDDDVVEISDGQSNDIRNDDVVEINDDAQKDDSEDKVQNDVKIKDAEKDDNVVEVKDIAQNDAIKDQASPNGAKTEKEVDETKDTLRALQTETKDVKTTPTRASARLATPGGIKTRRMSKLPE